MIYIFTWNGSSIKTYSLQGMELDLQMFMHKISLVYLVILHFQKFFHPALYMTDSVNCDEQEQFQLNSFANSRWFELFLCMPSCMLPTELHYLGCCKVDYQSLIVLNGGLQSSILMYCQCFYRLIYFHKDSGSL